jgi:hypothetical protein
MQFGQGEKAAWWFRLWFRQLKKIETKTTQKAILMLRLLCFAGMVAGTSMMKQPVHILKPVGPAKGYQHHPCQ